MKVLRLVQIAMLISIALYVPIILAVPTTVQPSTTIFHALTIMAAATLGVMFMLRRVVLAPAEATLASHPSDAKALNLWRMGQIVTFALGEAVALYGVVLHFLGFTLSQVAPFLVAGFLVILFFGPRRQSNEIG